MVWAHKKRKSWIREIVRFDMGKSVLRKYFTVSIRTNKTTCLVCTYASRIQAFTIVRLQDEQLYLFVFKTNNCKGLVGKAMPKNSFWSNQARDSRMIQQSWKILDPEFGDQGLKPMD